MFLRYFKKNYFNHTRPDSWGSWLVIVICHCHAIH